MEISLRGGGVRPCDGDAEGSISVLFGASSTTESSSPGFSGWIPG